MMRIARPSTSTMMVERLHPFHSLRIMPQTFENTTLSAMRMQNARVVSTGDEVRKPLPRLSPKNWLYQSNPARAQNNRLLTITPDLP